MGTAHNWPFVINLGNSIIGVAVLAMPFCFQQCGILLCMLVLLFCTWLTLTSCQLLMKAGITSRRRSYEFLAYHTHGAPGKLASEVGMIGFQLGTLIAQIVVIGDLGPAIISKTFGLETTSNLRMFLMILLCLTVGLPMALLKDLRAISRVSAVCITFYFVFVVYVFSLSLPNLWTAGWYQKVRLWRPEGLFQSLPILSFSFGCQTQLFLLYDALPEPSLKTMSGVVSSAVNLCAVAYLVVGFCGYIAFNSFDIPGDVLGVFPDTFFTDLMKVCFVFSIVITFPVIIFPMRASIYTLFFKKSKAHDDVMDSDSYLPPQPFKFITITIVVGSMIIGILIPNVEFILGMNGAIMGTLICYIFPALFFLKVMGSKPEGKNLAQLVLILGVTILLVSTFATLKSQDKEHAVVSQPINLQADTGNFDIKGPAQAGDPAQLEKPRVTAKEDPDKAEKDTEVEEDIRKEPPNPDPPDNDAKPRGDTKKTEGEEIKNEKESKREEGDEKKENIDGAEKIKNLNEEEAIVNKAQELEEKEKKQDELLAQLEKHRVEQEKLIAEQKQLLKEFKDHHEKDVQKDLEQQKRAAVPLQENPPAEQQQHQQQGIAQVLDNQQAQQQPQQQGLNLQQQNPPQQQQQFVNQQQNPPQQQQQVLNQQQGVINQQQNPPQQQQQVLNQQQNPPQQQQQVLNQQQNPPQQQQQVLNQQQNPAQQQQQVLNQQQNPPQQQQQVLNQQQNPPQQQQQVLNQQQDPQQQQQVLNQQQNPQQQQQQVLNQQQNAPQQQQQVLNQQQNPPQQQQQVLNQQQDPQQQQQQVLNQQQNAPQQQQQVLNQQQDPQQQDVNQQQFIPQAGGVAQQLENGMGGAGNGDVQQQQQQQQQVPQQQIQQQQQQQQPVQPAPQQQFNQENAIVGDTNMNNQPPQNIQQQQEQQQPQQPQQQQQQPQQQQQQQQQQQNLQYPDVVGNKENQDPLLHQQAQPDRVEDTHRIKREADDKKEKEEKVADNLDNTVEKQQALPAQDVPKAEADSDKSKMAIQANKSSDVKNVDGKQEKEESLKGNVLKAVNDSNKPRTNEEMRRKLKSSDLLGSDPVLDNAGHIEMGLGVARSLLHVSVDEDD